MEYRTFIYIVLNNFNKHASRKKNYLRANHSNSITKKPSKEIMKQSKLRNYYLKDTLKAFDNFKNKQQKCMKFFFFFFFFDM